MELEARDCEADVTWKFVNGFRRYIRKGDIDVGDTHAMTITSRKSATTTCIPIFNTINSTVITTSNQDEE